MVYSSNLKPLSPREQFQESVRNLNSEDVHRHKRKQSISLQYNPYELRHVSSLRVSPVRKTMVMTEPKSLRRVAEEPDFGTEERDVWSRSPPDQSHYNRASKFTLHDDVTESPTTNRGPSLPPLKPSRTGSYDTDERERERPRPRTRHGPVGISAFEEIATTESLKESEENAQSMRQPKFVEGTMTSRSSATASTWSDSDYATSDSEAAETDSDTTPKASRKRSGSLDLRDFQPPALTPSAIKRTLFGRREAKPTKKDVEPKPKAKSKSKSKSTSRTKHEDGDDEKKPKKRLRKSMSRLQFLGEKMKIFGSSSQDLPEQSPNRSIQTVEDEKSILDERKRKAEAAYAQQFGTKKQRDNDGSANLTSSPDMLQELAVMGNQKFDSSTVRARSNTTRSRRLSTGSVFAEPTSRPQSSSNDHDMRKRPSRRELEKENQQLRALLRESHSFRELDQVSNSDSEAIPPVPPLRIRRSLGPAVEARTAINVENAFGEEAADIAPPLPPQHPDRRVLSSVSNNRSRRARQENITVLPDPAPTERNVVSSLCNPLNNTPKLMPTTIENVTALPRPAPPTLPTSVSVIFEEPEGEIDEKKRSLRKRPTAMGKENTTMANTNDAARRREEWQWPDDVF